MENKVKETVDQCEKCTRGEAKTCDSPVKPHKRLEKNEGQPIDTCTYGSLLGKNMFSLLSLERCYEMLQEHYLDLRRARKDALDRIGKVDRINERNIFERNLVP